MKYEIIYICILSLYSCRPNQINLNRGEIKKVAIYSVWGLEFISENEISREAVFKKPPLILNDRVSLSHFKNRIEALKITSTWPRQSQLKEYHGVIYVFYDNGKIDSMDVLPNTIYFKGSLFDFEAEDRFYFDSAINNIEHYPH